MNQPSPKIDIASILEPYQKKVEGWLKESIPTLGDKSKLRDACEYALLNGGKRFRPILVIMIADALGKKFDVSSAALAVEFFHTASLIADDLPCMDDDDERRNKPTLHKVHGEGTALLSTYALISAGYERLAQNANEIKLVDAKVDSDRICVLALQNATFNTGLSGATGGQYLDVNPPNLTVDTIRDVIQKKTVSLFEISFVLGWLYGGGDIGKLDLVKDAAHHFGMAFQIADDLDDMAQDAKNGRLVNMAAVLGPKVAVQTFHAEILAFQNVLKQLKLEKSPLSKIADVLAASIPCQEKCV